MITLNDIESIDFTKLNGLVPAVVQHEQTGVVLMVGFMNRDALTRTLEEGFVTFWSRSRNELWQKGSTSGNRLTLVSIVTDCDRDTLLIRALPQGPVCHTGADTCFSKNDAPTGAVLARLQEIIAERHRLLPEGSYTTKLFREGTSRIAQKVGEEGLEVALASVQQQRERITEESADLLFHLLVLLEHHDLALADVEAVLKKRMK